MSWIIFAIWMSCCAISAGGSGQLMTCDYVYKIQKDVVKLELQNEDLQRKSMALEKRNEELTQMLVEATSKIKAQDEAIQKILVKIEGIESNPSSYWSSWENWSACVSQCEDGFNRRTQSRMRTKVCTEGAQGCKTDYETESRPCNSVEYAGGCATDENNGTVYGLAFSPYDEMAIAICAASKSGAFIQAVRRDCWTGNAPDCNSICKSLSRTCFNAVHAYKHRPVLQANPKGQEPDQAKTGLRAYHYGQGGCSYKKSCGPNFCCCRQ